MLNVEEEAQRIGQLYRQMTGTEPRLVDPPLSPIPPDANPEQYVRDNLSRLQQVLRQVASPRLPTHTPRLTVFENEREWRGVFDIPGVNRADVTANISHGVLRLTATRGVLTSVDPSRPVYSETSPCRFERIVPLPTSVRAETASARLENGVLTIRLTKESSTARQDLSIEVL